MTNVNDSDSYNTYVFQFYHSIDIDSVVQQLKNRGAIFVSDAS